MRAAAIATLLLATPALAQEPPTPIGSEAQPRAGALDAAGDIDSYSVSLKAGADRAVGGYYGCGRAMVTVKGPGGKQLTSFEIADDFSRGSEFRAVTTGTHLIRVQQVEDIHCGEFPQPYEITFNQDCRASSSTKCTLRPGASKTLQVTYAVADNDWIRLMPLVTGRRYELRVSGRYFYRLSVRTLTGKTVASTSGSRLAFKAPADRLFAVIETIDITEPGPYTVNLIQK
ncbi:MAG: hypothetical protein K0R61_4482 [Microvirga sp.]|nr:hypothetical protein [Microvirga sp.]